MMLYMDAPSTSSQCFIVGCSFFGQAQTYLQFQLLCILSYLQYSNIPYLLGNSGCSKAQPAHQAPTPLIQTYYWAGVVEPLCTHFLSLNYVSYRFWAPTFQGLTCNLHNQFLTGSINPAGTWLGFQKCGCKFSDTNQLSGLLYENEYLQDKIRFADIPFLFY